MSEYVAPPVDVAGEQPSERPKGRLTPRMDDVQATDAEILAFRDRELRSRFWGTSIGETLLKWFWKTWLGRWIAARFADAAAEELHGYAFWGPVALAITIAELLATGWFGDYDWPTISTTIGHLQDLDSLWGLPVVGLIGLAAFYALAYETRPSTEGRSELYLVRGERLQLRYGWPFVVGVTAAIGLLAKVFGAERFELGYAIYGSFAAFGIAIPLWLSRRRKHVVFPTLFFTFKCLRDRLRWVAALVCAGLAILVLHLALYPWPNLDRRPGTYAGLTAHEARGDAEDALKNGPKSKANLAFSTSIRAVAGGEDAWNVYFSESAGGSPSFSGCMVVVRKGHATPNADCSTG
jgi:hypothetical protein